MWLGALLAMHSTEMSLMMHLLLAPPHDLRAAVGLLGRGSNKNTMRPEAA